MKISSLALLLIAIAFAAPSSGRSSSKSAKCLDLTSKSSKAPKSNKAQKSTKGESCNCLCCNFGTCRNIPQFFWDTDCYNNATVCAYDDDGKLDLDNGTRDFIECCADDHEGDFVSCDKTRRRSRKLNQASALIERTVTEHENGHTVKVEAAEPSSLDWIHFHVTDMKERMERGEVPRGWDPLFRAYFDHVDEIDMSCHDESSDSFSCDFSSHSQCGADLIRAHAGYHQEIAESIRSGGSHKILKMHAKPASCQ